MRLCLFQENLKIKGNLIFKFSLIILRLNYKQISKNNFLYIKHYFDHFSKICLFKGFLKN